MFTGVFEYKKEQTLSTWIVDWNWENGLANVSQSLDGYNEIYLFAAYYDEQDELFITEELTNAIDATFKSNLSEKPIYITFVNDVIQRDDSFIHKDPELIHRILKNEKSMNQHIDQLVKFTKDFPFDGLVIDFEKIHIQDLKKYETFLHLLAKEVESQNLSLKIVVEPNVNLANLTLPTNASYMVMAYNLYGTHSEPGPKASIPFIHEVIANTKHLPGEPTIIFSTGGFDWSSHEIKSLTEEQAAALQLEHQANVTRDQTSGALTFQYVDAQGIEHTVWYGDTKTYATWIHTSQQRDINHFSIWRSDGLCNETLEWLESFY